MSINKKGDFSKITITLLKLKTVFEMLCFAILKPLIITQPIIIHCEIE